MSSCEYDIVIVGGGAAGLMAAVLAVGKDCRVAVIEKNDQCGKKMLITGKGRCNITNSRRWDEFKEHIHPDSGFFRPSFMAFSNTDTVSLLGRLGLATVEERGMRIFPLSGRSVDVRNAMVSYISRAGNVELCCKSEVISISRGAVGFDVAVLRLEDRMRVDCIHARNVIVATGGLSYPSTGSTGDGYKFASKLGHTIVETMPSLTALIPYNYNFSLVGLTLRNVSLTLEVDGGQVQQEFGELTFTTGGLEGALGFRVSRKAVHALEAGRKVEVVIDLKPAVQAVKPFMDSDSSLTVSNLPVRLKHWRFSIKSYVDYSRAVVTSGGVSLKEISRKTMESKVVPGLYFAGEVMDLDGDTGGYNLQIAFSTAAAAVNAAMASGR